MQQEEIVKAIMSSGCFKRGLFKLSSGRISTYYIDIRNIYSHPKELKLIVSELAKNISERFQFDAICGIATGGLPLASILSYILSKPFIYVRKVKKEYGTTKAIEGDYRKGWNVIIVDDVATTGSSILRAIDYLTAEGINVLAAYVVVDREEGAEKLLESRGVSLYSLLKINYILKTLKG